MNEIGAKEEQMKATRYGGDYVDLADVASHQVIEVDPREVKRIVRQVVRDEIRSLIGAALSRAMREAKQRHHGLF